MLEELRKKQEHNREILKEVTELELKAFDSILDPERFAELIQRIELLQNQYKRK